MFGANDGLAKMLVIAEFEVNGKWDAEKVCVDGCYSLNTILTDGDHNNVIVHLLLCRANGFMNWQTKSNSRDLKAQIQVVSILDNVEDLCDK